MVTCVCGLARLHVARHRSRLQTPGTGRAYNLLGCVTSALRSGPDCLLSGLYRRLGLQPGCRMHSSIGMGDVSADVVDGEGQDLCLCKCVGRGQMVRLRVCSQFRVPRIPSEYSMRRPVLRCQQT